MPVSGTFLPCFYCRAEVLWAEQPVLREELAWVPVKGSFKPCPPCVVLLAETCPAPLQQHPRCNTGLAPLRSAAEMKLPHQSFGELTELLQQL